MHKLVKCHLLLAVLINFSFILPSRFSPYERLVKCGDPSISYPDVDHGYIWQYPATTVASFVVMIFLCWDAAQRSHMRHNRVENKNLNLLSPLVFVTVCLMGFSSTVVISIVISRSVGYLSPNFLAVCKPDLQLIIQQCSSGADFVRVHCNAVNKLSIIMARSSCPSIWVTLWSFMMTTVVVWTQHRNFSWIGRTKLANVFVRLTIQLIATSTAAGFSFLIFFLNDADILTVYVSLALGGFIAWFTFELVANDLVGWEDDSTTSWTIKANHRAPSRAYRRNWIVMLNWITAELFYKFWFVIIWEPAHFLLAQKCEFERRQMFECACLVTSNKHVFLLPLLVIVFGCLYWSIGWGLVVLRILFPFFSKPPLFP